MDEGDATAARPAGSVRTSQVDFFLRLSYWWVCSGVIILSGLFAVFAPVGVYLAWMEGHYEPRLGVEVHRVTSALLHLAAVIAAVQALRWRHRPTGYGRRTLIAGGIFVLAMAVTMIGMALWW